LATYSLHWKQDSRVADSPAGPFRYILWRHAEPDPGGLIHKRDTAMTWLTEFSRIVDEAAHLGQPVHREAAEAAVQDGDPTRLLDAFPGGVRIDDPRFGRVEGEAALKEFHASSQRWLRDHAGHPRAIAMTMGAKRVVGEFDLELTDEGRTFVLPVAIVVEPDPAKRSVWIRTYHSQWPLLGHHVVRPPLLLRDPSVAESDVVGEYQSALAAGDADRITATFEPDGCFREPAGPQYRRCGTDVLHGFFSLFFQRRRRHPSRALYGHRGRRPVSPGVQCRPMGRARPAAQAGVAVYERGSSGKLRRGARL